MAEAADSGGVMKESPGPSGVDIDALRVFELEWAFAPSRVLATGLQLGVFSQMAAGSRTVESIARAVGATERGVRMLMDSLTALELINKQNGEYTLTPTAAQFLVRESPDYMGAAMEGDAVWKAWGGLTEAIRTGRPTHRMEQQPGAEDFYPQLIKALHVLNSGLSKQAAEVLGAGTSHRGMKVVDVGCGSAVWSIAIAEADPEAHVTAQDFPGVLETTRHYLRRHGVESRYDFLPGDLKTVDFGEGRFDLALLGHIVHTEGEDSSRKLFRRLHRALRPGGRVAIVDMIPNNDRTGPVFPVLFALNMLVNSTEGDTFSLADYERWFVEAGFANVEAADIGFHSPLIIGTKS
jgi:ubiquinone/menaquinone biosynthesis C-methylase UbiE